MNDRERWNRKYREGVRHDNPNVRLIMYQDRLARGRALDVAGGLGENAAILALAGWKTVLAEISDEAVRRARRRAEELKADVEVVQADARALPFGAEFDTVACTYYLDRSVDLRRFLKPGGTLFFETFTVADLRYAPDLPREYCLESGEMKRLYSDLEVLHYAEEDDGRKAFATLIARNHPSRSLRA